MPVVPDGKLSPHLELRAGGVLYGGEDHSLHRKDGDYLFSDDGQGIHCGGGGGVDAERRSPLLQEN